jgi:hypothetical protein
MAHELKRADAFRNELWHIKLFGRFVAWSNRTMTNLDLIDWTLQEARQLSPEHHMPSELEAKPSLSKLLEVLEGERAEPSAHETISRIVDPPSIKLDTEDLTARPTSEVVAGPKPTTISKSTQAAPSISLDVLGAPKSLLLKAIVEPDLYTAPVDRDRAITLRWALRDINSNRLKWSPVNQHDLRDLIDMGLVEMHDDAPVLTNAGVGAISQSTTFPPQPH